MRFHSKKNILNHLHATVYTQVMLLKVELISYVNFLGIHYIISNRTQLLFLMLVKDWPLCLIFANCVI